MTIQHLNIEQERLSTAEAELVVFVEVSSSTECKLGGQLTGPRCATIETIQLAYPLKPHAPSGLTQGVLAGRFLIAEPNLWTERTPFVYEGNVELIAEGKVLDRRPIQVAFKLS